MATVRETLQLLITGDSSGAVRAIKETGAAASKDLTSTQSKLALISGGLTKFGAGAVVAGAGIAAFGVKMSNAYVSAARDALKLQRVTGATAEDASRLGVVAQQSGIQVDKLAKAFVFLSKTSVTPKGADALQKLGVSLEDSNGKAKPLPQVLAQVAEGYTHLGDAAEKNRVLVALFGRSGADLGPLMSKGAAGIDEIIKKSDELGLTLGQKDLDGVKEYIKAQRDLSLAFHGLEVQIGRIAFPAVSSALQTAAGVAKDAAGAFNSLPDPLKKVAGEIAGVGSGALVAVGGLAVVAGQALKLRDAFTVVSGEGEAAVRSLNNLGKAASGVALVGGAVVGLYALNEGLQYVLGSAAQAEQAMKDLQTATTNAGRTAAIEDLRQSALKAQITFTDWSKDVSSADATTDSFNRTLEQSPALAQLFIDTVKKSGKFKLFDNDEGVRLSDLNGRIAISTQEVADWQKQVNRKKAEDIAAAAAQDQYNQSVLAGADAVEQSGQKAQTAADQWAAYADSIKKATDPFYAAAKAGQDFGDAQLKVAEAQDAVNKQPTAENMLKLAAASQEAVVAAQDQMGALASLRAEIEKNPAAVDQAIAVLEQLKQQQPQLAGAIDQTENSIRREAFAASAASGPTQQLAAAINTLKATAGNITWSVAVLGIEGAIASLRTFAVLSASVKAVIASTQAAIAAAGGPDGDPTTPGRAAGGPVRAGSPYVVGEKGPELFVPGQAGTIIPNKALRGGDGGFLGGGRTVVLQQTNNFHGVVSDEQWVLDSISKANRRGMTALAP